MPDAATSVSFVDAAAELRECGSVVLRRAWTPEQLALLRAVLSAFIDYRGAKVAAGEASAGEVVQHEHGAGTVGMMVQAGFADFALLTDLFRGSAYHRLCAAYLQDEVFYARLHRLGFRRHDPLAASRTFVPFHQDSGSQEGQIRDVLNCWIPLDPGCGADAPGLQVVRDPCEPSFPIRRVEQVENLVYDPIAIDPAKVAETYGDRLMAPAFEVGDVLVFTEHVIHRTYVTPQMTQPRLNFEFRVFSPAHLAPGTDAEAITRSSLRLA